MIIAMSQIEAGVKRSWLFPLTQREGVRHGYFLPLYRSSLFLNKNARPDWHAAKMSAAERVAVWEGLRFYAECFLAPVLMLEQHICEWTFVFHCIIVLLGQAGASSSRLLSGEK